MKSHKKTSKDENDFIFIILAIVVVVKLSVAVADIVCFRNCSSK